MLEIREYGLDVNGINSKESNFLLNEAIRRNSRILGLTEQQLIKKLNNNEFICGICYFCKEY